MSTAYELNGRVAQKQRTREALVAAARRLVAEGITPTVEDAAAAASISRTTAYRYFPNQRALLVAAHPETFTDSLLPEHAPAEPGARLQAVLGRMMDSLLENEVQHRTMLRLSLEATDEERAALPLRQGRAIAWYGEALEPLRGQLSGDEVDRLVLAIRSATGIEALVWLTDVAGLPREQASELMRWSAMAMYHAAVAGSPPPTRRRPRQRR